MIKINLSLSHTLSFSLSICLSISLSLMETSQDSSSSEHIRTDRKQLWRSISTKEPSFRELHLSPPRFSSSSIPPLRSVPSPSRSFPPNVSHRCISSFLVKNARILSIVALGRFIYIGSDANVIRIWKIPQFTECGQLRSNSGSVCALAVSDDRIFVAYTDGKIRVWRRSWGDGIPTHVRDSTVPRLGDYLRSYMIGKDRKMKHLGPISSLAINVSDDLLYSASVDSTVKVWRISNLRCIETIQAHEQSVNAVVVGDDGMLYTASDDASIKVWRLNSCGGDRLHQLAITLPTRSSPVKALALTTDGSVLYGGCSDGYVHCWLKGWLSGHLHYSGLLQGHHHAVTCLASVSNYVASGSADLTCRIWLRQREGQHTCLAVLEGHRGPIRCVAAFASSVARDDDEDGCIVCTGSVDGTLKVWHVTSSGSVGQGQDQGIPEYFEFQRSVDHEHGDG